VSAQTPRRLAADEVDQLGDRRVACKFRFGAGEGDLASERRPEQHRIRALETQSLLGVDPGATESDAR
jgi:hypothetical protein